MPMPFVSALAGLLVAAAQGAPPAADGLVEVHGRPAGVRAAVLGFTAHHVVAADVDPAWVLGRLQPWDLGAPLGAAFLCELAAQVGSPAGTLDVVLVAPEPRVVATLAGLGHLPLRESRPLVQAGPHPRRNEHAWQTADGAGTLILGRGLADRWEMRLDVAPEASGRGVGRSLAAAASSLVLPGEPVFAQVAPGNVASLRALLAAGYRPIGAEVLFFDGD